MSPPVFISYARTASCKQAEALHRALGGPGGLAFLDTSEIHLGEKFPPKLVDALLASRLVVLFASEDYFQRQYCLWELEVALGECLSARSGAAKEAMLASIVVALPSRGSTPPPLLPLPPGLRQTNWPMADDVEALEQEVRGRLAGNPRTLAERLDAAGTSTTAFRTRLLSQSNHVPPMSLAALRVYPRVMPPSLRQSFVGRSDELWRIHYTLSLLRDAGGTGASGAALTGALQGAGGFGKTRLALEYMHRFGPSHYPGGLFWVNADGGPDRLEEQFHGILRMLRPDVPELVEFRTEARDAAQEMAQALEAIAARERILYVVDNIPEPGPDEAPKSLTTWCPVIGKVALLATSRARLDLGTESVHALPVSELVPEAAVVLLREGLGPEGLDDSGWRHIAQWVGHLPLALELLNRTLRAGALAPEELLARAERRGPAAELEKQMGVLRRFVPPGALRGVAETFSVSYERLSEAEQFTARLLAYLSPEPIPRELLAAFGSNVAADETCATLASRHFVTPVETTGAVRMFGSVHRLLADYLRHQARDPLVEVWQACKGLLHLMSPSACEDPNAWPLLDACLPHAECIFECLMKPGNSLAPSRGIDEVSLGFALGHFYLEKGLAARARAVDERVVQRAREVYGPEHLATLKAMSNLAAVLHEQGCLEDARTLQEQLLEVSRRVLGEEHPSTLTSLNNLAAILGALGDLEEAQSLGVQVLEVRRRVLGEEHEETLSAMRNLAGTLHAQKNLREARALLEKVLEVSCRMSGEEHPQTLTTMNNLASILREQSDLDAARALEEWVLDARRRLLGDEHPYTLSSFNNLAVTLLAQRDFEGARALQERVLEVGRQVRGEEHPDTLKFMGNLAATLKDLKEVEKARALEQQMLDGCRRVLGNEHPYTLTAMSNLALTLRMQGEQVEGRALQERVLKGRRRVLGEAHPDTFVAMGVLAETLRADGDLEGARTLEEQVLMGSLRVLGEEHPSTIISMEHLASILNTQGEVDRARVLEERVLELRQAWKR